MQRKVFTINGLSIKVLKINWFWFKDPPGLAPGGFFSTASCQDCPPADRSTGAPKRYGRLPPDRRGDRGSQRLWRWRVVLPLRCPKIRSRGLRSPVKQGLPCLFLRRIHHQRRRRRPLLRRLCLRRPSSHPQTTSRCPPCPGHHLRT